MLPYAGFDVPHKYPRDHWKFRMGFARWPEGRIAGIAADEAGGFSTPFFIAPGDRILIDARTDVTGYIRFELSSLAKGRMLLEKDSVPFNGDATRHEIGWSRRNRLPIEPGTAIKLRFALYRAQIYAIRFARHDR